MKSVLLQSGSAPVSHSIVPGSPRISLSINDTVSGLFSGERSNASSPRISLHLNFSRRSIRRALSESDVIKSETEFSGGLSSGVRSRSFSTRITDEEFGSESHEVGVGGIGSLMLTEREYDQRTYARDRPGSGIPVEELEFAGGGVGKGRMSDGGSGGDDFGTGGFTGGSADRSKIGAYYQEMLKSNPTNSLLLRNYGKYLQEVEGDMIKAKEYYGRAILASPGDGEVLSLYGKLIWETERDEDRAKSYFDQAVHASPDDCMVLGSYAQFMWEAEAEEEEEEEEEMKREVVGSAAMIEAF